MSHTRPSTVYTCTVGASNGAFDVSAKINVTLEPDKPDSILLNEALPANVGNTEFTLNWCVSFTGGIPLTPSVIGAPNGSTVTHDFNAMTRQGKSTVKQLEADTVFKVKVKLSNSKGEAESNNVTVMTTCVPDKVVVENAKVDLGKKTISFTDSRTGPCNANIDFVVRNGNTVWPSSATRYGNNLTIEIDKIIDEGTYSLTITVINSGNYESAQSEVITFTQGPASYLMTEAPECLSGAIIAIATLSVIVIIQFRCIGFMGLKLKRRHTVDSKQTVARTKHATRYEYDNPGVYMRESRAYARYNVAIFCHFALFMQTFHFVL